MNEFRAAENFLFAGRVREVVPYGNGHINDTYAVTCDCDCGATLRYILQRLNANVFPERDGLMRNMIAVTDFLRAAVIADGGDPERECLYLIPTRDGKKYYTSPEGEVWRATQFIENTDAYLVADDTEMFRDAGRAFGKFVARLSGFDASTLFEVIPDFHNTAKRYLAFRRALEEDACGRAAGAAAEIAFVEERKDGCSVLVDALAEGRIPTRVTHNDTKLNNVLIDVDTKKAVCVIDLDTVMPGTVLYDFGDGVRGHGGQRDGRGEKAHAPRRTHDDLRVRDALPYGLPCGRHLFQDRIPHPQPRPCAHPVQAGEPHGRARGGDGTRGA